MWVNRVKKEAYSSQLTKEKKERVRWSKDLGSKIVESSDEAFKK